MDFFDQLQDLNRPTVTKKSWMEAVTLTLAVTADLDRIADECIASKIFALDIETTGLDARVFTQADGSKTTNDKIVGLCIAPNEKQSYYLPIRHKDDGAAANIPPRMVRDMLLKIQASGAVTIFHNGKFDQEFLEHDPAGAMGNWDEPSKWEDTILLAYLRDAREKRRGLKHLAKTMLDREMIELEDLFPKGIKRLDFSTLDPTWEPTVWYAASDALNTLALYHKLNPEVTQKDPFGKGQATVYKIEKICITATRWMERCRVPMDRGTIIKLIKLGQHEWFESLAELYSGVETILGRDVRPGWFKSMQGQHHRINNPFDADCMEPSYMEHREQAIKDLGFDPDVKVPKSVPSLTDPKVRETVQFPNTYDVTIPTELGLLLRELGVEGLAVTEKSGQVKTSKDELDRIFEGMGDDLPFAPKIKRFREVAKGLSSNLFPVYHDLAPENSPDGRLWVGFNGIRTDTGRFATKASESKDFTGQSRWNLHSIPATYDKSKPECVRKMRTSIKAGPGKILFAIDYSGVELRIVTNLSGESKWVDEFFRCSGCDHRFEKGLCPPHFCPSCWSDKIGDLHTLTALAIYGEDAATKSDFKQKRQAAKGLNFAMCYGGGGSAAQRSVGVDKEEGWRIKRQFDKSYRGLAKWWEEQHKTARKQKYVTTAYGRKYPLPDIDHTDGGFRSKAERNSVNGPVQGTSADIMKFAMGLIYRECKDRGWLDRAKMCVTIHDELVFEIDEDLAEEAVIVINELMTVRTVKNLGWIIPLKNDIEFGEDWTVPFNLVAMTNPRETKPEVWSERWQRVFPKFYADYLANGGTGEIKAVAEAAPVAEPIKDVPEFTVPLSSQSRHVYTIPAHRLTPELAEVLARVVSKCIGRGKEEIVIETDRGLDLLGFPFKASFAEFKIIAGYEGL